MGESTEKWLGENANDVTRNEEGGHHIHQCDMNFLFNLLSILLSVGEWPKKREEREMEKDGKDGGEMGWHDRMQKERAWGHERVTKEAGRNSCCILYLPYSMLAGKLSHFPNGAFLHPKRFQQCGHRRRPAKITR